MTEIAILIPVLGRPRNAAQVVDSIAASSRTDPRVVFVCSPGDTDEIDACRATDADTMIVTWDPGPGDYARKINAGFRHTSEQFVFTGADDLRFHPGWDTAALEHAGAAGVVGTNDLGNRQTMNGLHSTHSLVWRPYVNLVGATFHDGPGVVLHEGYDHQYVDTELVAVAKSLGRWAWAGDAMVEHLHPFWRKGEQDATYAKALARSREDRRLFQERERDFNAKAIAA